MINETIDEKVLVEAIGIIDPEIVYWDDKFKKSVSSWAGESC